MKVGILLDEYSPTDGGAFTMQGDVLRALLDLATESRHNFVVIDQPNSHLKADLKSQRRVEFLPVQQPSLLEKSRAFISRNWPALQMRTRWASTLNRKIRQAGIEFVWFLSQRPQDIDLPYMAIVLDLQHRVQPWFPEVSEFGHWDVRERAFARHLGRAAAVITGTQVGQNEISTFYQVPRERIHILPHPTPNHALKAVSNSAEKILDKFALKPGYLLYPAQFWAHKNHINLLHALKQLGEESLELHLVLSGSDFGNRDFVLQKIKELGLTKQVHITEFVDQDDLTVLYQNALALTYLSFFGPENLPPLEAFALGCPVIAAQVDGADEQMGDAALLVDPRDPAAIAAAIHKIYGDKILRGQLVARGKERAARWTAQDFVRGAFKILDDFEPIRRIWK